MYTYTHRVQYYETDRMGVTHHSNYIRWMEEARSEFLKSVGWPYAKLEELGIISPVIEMSCKYKNTTTYDDVVQIHLYNREFKGVKLLVHYVMTKEDGTVVLEGDSAHCFISADGKPLRLAKLYPEFYQAIVDSCEEC